MKTKMLTMRINLDFLARFDRAAKKRKDYKNRADSIHTSMENFIKETK